MKVLLIDNSIEVSLTEFLHTNTAIPDVDHISDDDAKKIEALQLGESLYIGLCNVKFNKLQYKGYTIQEDFRNPYNREPEYMFYPTSEGIQHDADGDSEGYRYTGTCKCADSIEDAKDRICEIIIESQPVWKVQTKVSITKFNWLNDAIRFADRFNGQLIPVINSI
jgi:hypothetical protein